MLLVIIITNPSVRILQDYMVSMYLRQAWTDARLAYEPFRNKIKK